MVRPAVTLAAALVCCIGSVQAVGNGPYLGGLTFQSTQTVSANIRFTGRGPTGSNASAQSELVVESGGGSLNVTKQIYYNHPNVTLTHIHVAYANSTATPNGQLQLINAPIVSIYQNASGNNFLNGNDSPIGQDGLQGQILANDFSIPLAGLPLECLLDCCTVVTTENGGCCPDSGTLPTANNPQQIKNLPLVGCYIGNHQFANQSEISSGWLQVVG